MPEKVTPDPDQPGTLLQQLDAIALSIALGEQTGTSAAQQWQRARQAVIPHARGESNE